VIAEIVGLPEYESRAPTLLTDEDRMAMEYFIASGPEDHPIISGTGGFRKARWAAPGKGKSGGFRVIYFYLPEPGRVYLATIYAKSRKDTLSAAD
jgi:mRNA-degrading endonuclease RelE of RelBE toxin-antitoxin system